MISYCTLRNGIRLFFIQNIIWCIVLKPHTSACCLCRECESERGGGRERERERGRVWEREGGWSGVPLFYSLIVLLLYPLHCLNKRFTVCLPAAKKVSGKKGWHSH